MVAYPTRGTADWDDDLQAYIDQQDTAGLDRANHTGTQAASTITGLATVATSGSYADLTGTPTIPDSPDDIGAADLDADGFHQLAELAPGSVLTAYWDGTGWIYDGATLAARPTARTDITVWFIDPIGDGALPAFSADGVDVLLQNVAP